MSLGDFRIIRDKCDSITFLLSAILMLPFQKDTFEEIRALFQMELLLAASLSPYSGLSSEAFWGEQCSGARPQ